MSYKPGKIEIKSRPWHSCFNIQLSNISCAWSQCRIGPLMLDHCHQHRKITDKGFVTKCHWIAEFCFLPSSFVPVLPIWVWCLISERLLLLYKMFSEGKETISWVRDWHVKYYHLQNTGLKPPWRQRSWAWATEEGKQESHNHIFIFRENEKLNKL